MSGPTDPGAAIRCPAPLALADLVDYERGELSPADEERVEEHVFACADCTARLEAVQRLGAGVAALVREHAVTATVTDAVVQRLAAGGLRLREYRLTPGGRVDCTAAPEDDLVVVRLTGVPRTTTGVRIALDLRVLASGETVRRDTPDVAVDRATGEVVMVFPGDVVRGYPRSSWTMAVRDDHGQPIGTYAMDHTPWQELPAGSR